VGGFSCLECVGRRGSGGIPVELFGIYVFPAHFRMPGCCDLVDSVVFLFIRVYLFLGSSGVYLFTLLSRCAMRRHVNYSLSLIFDLLSGCEL
jgi:hypothetical protein